MRLCAIRAMPLESVLEQVYLFLHRMRQVKAIAERLVTDALATLEPSLEPITLTQQHVLIRSAREYGDLFAPAAAQDNTLQGQKP